MADEGNEKKSKNLAKSMASWDIGWEKNSLCP